MKILYTLGLIILISFNSVSCGNFEENIIITQDNEKNSIIEEEIADVVINQMDYHQGDFYFSNEFNTDGATFLGSQRNLVSDPIFSKVFNLQGVPDGNYNINLVNDSADKIKKYYKDQVPVFDKKVPFTDPLFRPNLGSIIGENMSGFVEPNVEKRKGYLKAYKTPKGETEWKRIGDILGPDAKLFDTISVDASCQSEYLNNGHFITAAAALAKNPQLILQLFRGSSHRKNGEYEVAIKINGIWQIVFVDDKFPIVKSTKKLIFANPSNNAKNEFWLLLLEKAWAKVNGGYVNISQGSAFDVLSAFSNFSYNLIEFKEIAKFFPNSDSLVENTWINTLNFVSRRNPLVANLKMNESSSYTMTVQGVGTSTVNGQTKKLIRLFDPLATNQLIESLKTDSNNLNDSLTSQLKPKEMWVDIDKFVSNFHSYFVFHYQTQQISKTLTIDKDESEFSHIITITTTIPAITNIYGLAEQLIFNRTIREDNMNINMILVQKKASCDAKNDPENCFVYLANFGYKSFATVNMPANSTFYLYVKKACQDYENDKKYPYTINFGSNFSIDVSYNMRDVRQTIARLGCLDHVMRDVKPTLNDDKVNVLEGNYLPNTTLGCYITYNLTKLNQKFYLINKSINYDVLYPISFKQTIVIKPKFGHVIILCKEEDSESESSEINFFMDKSDIGEPPVRYMDLENILKPKPSNQSRLGDEFEYKEIDLNLIDLVNGKSLKDASISFYKAKYPSIMNALLSLAPLSDSVQPIFKDRYFFSQYSFVLGEYKLGNNSILHGRAFFVDNDGSVYIGYAINNNFNATRKLA